MTPYEAGRIVGGLLILFVIPALLTFWAIRLRRRGSAAWRFVVALAVFFLLSGIAFRVVQATREAQQVASIIQVDPERAFPTDTPYRFEPIRDRQLTGMIERMIRREAPFARVAARLVTERETPVGFSLALTAPPEAFVEEDFIAGVASGISERSGRPPERGTIDGRTVLQFEVTERGNSVYGVVWRRPRTNLTLLVVAPTVVDREAIAVAMIRAESSPSAIPTET